MPRCRTRATLLARGGPHLDEIVRYAHTGPSTTVGCTGRPRQSCLTKSVPDYRPHAFEDNLCGSPLPNTFERAKRNRRHALQHVWAPFHLIERTALQFPAWLAVMSSEGAPTGTRRANLSPEAERYLSGIGADGRGPVPPRSGHAPPIPIPRGERRADCAWGGRASPARAGPMVATGRSSRAVLLASAERGRELAALLDVDAQVVGVTSGTLRPETRLHRDARDGGR